MIDSVYNGWHSISCTTFCINHSVNIQAFIYTLYLCPIHTQLWQFVPYYNYRQSWSPWTIRAGPKSAQGQTLRGWMCRVGKKVVLLYKKGDLARPWNPAGADHCYWHPDCTVRSMWAYWELLYWSRVEALFNTAFEWRLIEPFVSVLKWTISAYWIFFASCVNGKKGCKNRGCYIQTSLFYIWPYKE